MTGPIGNGQPASPFLQVPERRDAVLSEKDDRQRSRLFGEVGVLGVVGNEDGARHVQSIVRAALSELGRPFRSRTTWARTSWSRRRSRTPTSSWCAASDAAHLTAVLEDSPYPGV